MPGIDAHTDTTQHLCFRKLENQARAEWIYILYKYEILQNLLWLSHVNNCL